MTTPLTDDQFGEAVLNISSTAFRLERQRAYDEPVEREAFERFLAGNPDQPDEVPAIREYLDYVAEATQNGKRIERVRVHDDPPTPYQRWERWVGQWNVAAGEVIHYLTRQQADDVGLLPGAEDADWWLLDSSRVIIMRFDGSHRRVSNELITDPEVVDRACALRDLAVRMASGQDPTADV